MFPIRGLNDCQGNFGPNKGRSAMEEQTALAATLAASAAPVRTFEVILAAGLGLHTLVVAACIGIIFRWHRDMKTWRARGERQHQEDMIAFEIDARRRREERKGWMTNPDARRR